MCSTTPPAFHTILSYGNLMLLSRNFTVMFPFPHNSVLRKPANEKPAEGKTPEAKKLSTQFCPTETMARRTWKRYSTTMITFHTILSYGNSTSGPNSKRAFFFPHNSVLRKQEVKVINFDIIINSIELQLSTQFCPTETTFGEIEFIMDSLSFPHNSVLRKLSRAKKRKEAEKTFPHNSVLRKPTCRNRIKDL